MAEAAGEMTKQEKNYYFIKSLLFTHLTDDR